MRFWRFNLKERINGSSLIFKCGSFVGVYHHNIYACFEATQ